MKRCSSFKPFTQSIQQKGFNHKYSKRKNYEFIIIKQVQMFQDLGGPGGYKCGTKPSNHGNP